VKHDCAGTITNGGSNIIRNYTDCTGAALADDVDPLLKPLAFNGGPTETHAIPTNSPAKDRLAAGPDCTGDFDQRGVPRPAGAGCDAGAYEYAECHGVLVNIVGTIDTDKLTGTEGPDGVLAFGGNDTISTLGGDDAVCAGDGNDTVYGGDGADHLFGEGDKDKLFGEAGTDELNGGPKKDRCVGGPEKDTFAACESKRQ
jgi:Ca2+-binding RTX toxin-like protein